jgi:hypothetical protein
VGSKKKRIYISGFEGSQAMPVRPSGRGSAYLSELDFYFLFNTTPLVLHYSEI